MVQFELEPRGPFSFAASMEFIEGFTPAAYSGRRGELRMAFVPDTAFRPGAAEHAIGVSVREAEGGLVGTIVGLDDDADPQPVKAQVERILSLDIDGSGFASLGRRDPVIGKLQARYPGLRPVLFANPYEAAAWTLIGRRTQMSRAARMKGLLSAELGEQVELNGGTYSAFPGPSRLATLEGFPGLPEAKIDYLRALGERAKTGDLDAAHLRSMRYEKALSYLQELPGIGPFSAELILIRGAGFSNVLPVNEPRFAQSLTLAYGLPQAPTATKIETMGQNWKQYRSWVALLLRRNLDDQGKGGDEATEDDSDE